MSCSCIASRGKNEAMRDLSLRQLNLRISQHYEYWYANMGCGSDVNNSWKITSANDAMSLLYVNAAAAAADRLYDVMSAASVMRHTTSALYTASRQITYTRVHNVTDISASHVSDDPVCQFAFLHMWCQSVQIYRTENYTNRAAYGLPNLIKL